MEASLRAYDWLVLAAIMVGPLIGVWVTRWIDRANETKSQRWELFVTLRRTRGLELSQDHVAAINMVPVLFADDRATMEEWGKLMSALNNPGWNSEDQTAREAVLLDSENARHNLIRRIGEVVGSKLPDKEEHRLGYAPVAWSKEFLEQAEARTRFLEVLNGERPLKMLAGVYDLSAAPEASETESEPPKDILSQEPKAD